ncbi:MAG: TFIIB-type zinc ribbon-containing protein [Fervidicoccaceae archaeon]
MDRCEACGGTIVWDYRTGDIICSSCGLVIGRIYEHEEERSGDKKAEETCGKKQQSYPKSFRLYLKISRRKPRDLLIDEERFRAFLKDGKAIRVFAHPKDAYLRKMLEKNESLREIYEGYVEKNPKLSCRTMRAKVASAMILQLYFSGRKIRGEDISRIARETGVSKWHAAKLIDILGRYYPPLSSGQRSRIHRRCSP